MVVVKKCTKTLSYIMTKKAGKLLVIEVRLSSLRFSKKIMVMGVQHFSEDTHVIYMLSYNLREVGPVEKSSRKKCANIHKKYKTISL